MRRLARSCWPFIAALCASRLYTFWRIMSASEDAYITFRYCRNIARGLGPVFNPGERVMGFTSPLWTALCSLPFALGIDPVYFSRTISLACDVVSLILLWRLLEKHAGLASARCFAFFFAAWPFWSALSASGLEMSATVCLLAIAATTRAWWALVLLFLARPEGAAMACVLALWATPRARALAACAVAPVLLMLAWFYGSPIPHSVIAKAVAYGHPGPFAAPHWWLWLPAIGTRGMPGEIVHLYSVSIILLASIVAGAPAIRRIARSPLAAAIIASGAVWACYAAVGAAYFWWYMTLPLLCAGLVASIGLPRIVRVPTLYACIAGCILISWPAYEKLYTARAIAEAAPQQLADFIAEHGAAGQSLMAESVGMLGFRTDLRVIDMVGIVSPAPPRGPGWMGERIRSERPDWIVARYSEISTLGGFGAESPAFLSAADMASAIAAYKPVRWIASGRNSKAPEPNDVVLLGRR